MPRKPMPRMFSVSALNERLAIVSAVGLISLISLHHWSTSASSWSCGTTLLTRPIFSASAALYREAVFARVHVLVAAGAKGLVAGAREHHHVGALFFVGAAQRVDQFLERLVAERVVDLGPVDRDANDTVAHFVEDVLVVFA